MYQKKQKKMLNKLSMFKKTLNYKMIYFEKFGCKILK